MAADYIKGQNLIITVNGIMVGCDKETNIEINTETFDTTTKCSVDGNGVLFGETIPTTITATASGNGLVPILNSAGQPAEQSLMQLAVLQLAQTKVSVTFEVPAAPGKVRVFFAFDAWVTSLSAGGSIGEVVTYDYELTSTGIITKIPVS